MIRNLEEGGFTTQQAEALVDWWAKLVVENLPVVPEAGGIKSAFKNFERNLTITIYTGQLLFVVAVIFFTLMIHGR